MIAKVWKANSSSPSVNESSFRYSSHQQIAHGPILNTGVVGELILSQQFRPRLLSDLRFASRWYAHHAQVNKFWQKINLLAACPSLLASSSVGKIFRTRFPIPVPVENQRESVVPCPRGGIDGGGASLS